jgi:dynein heavy chain
MWCRAIDNYAKIAKEVEPKKRKVTEMQAKLDLKNKELMVKQDELQKVRDRVARLEKECDETVQRKNRLEEELERTKRRCIAAEKLTLLLADEGVRWKDQIERLDVTLQEIIGDVFISACIISYLGAFTGPYRD